MSLLAFTKRTVITVWYHRNSNAGDIEANYVIIFYKTVPSVIYKLPNNETILIELTNCFRTSHISWQIVSDLRISIKNVIYSMHMHLIIIFISSFVVTVGFAVDEIPSNKLGSISFLNLYINTAVSFIYISKMSRTYFF